MDILKVFVIQLVRLITYLFVFTAVHVWAILKMLYVWLVRKLGFKKHAARIKATIDDPAYRIIGDAYRD